MAVNGGYDVKPAENVPSKYECPICMLILRQAVQTLCGHHLMWAQYYVGTTMKRKFIIISRKKFQQVSS